MATGWSWTMKKGRESRFAVCFWRKLWDTKADDDGVRYESCDKVEGKSKGRGSGMKKNQIWC